MPGPVPAMCTKTRAKIRESLCILTVDKSVALWYNIYSKGEEIPKKREVLHMTRLDRMRKQYEALTAAEGYAIGFHIGDDVYCAMIDRIPRRYTKIQKECSKAGGGYGLYINVKNKKFKSELLRKAIKVGTVADLVDEKFNKGVMFEKLVYEINGQTFRGKDSVRFYEAGDITIDGKEIQVKYEHARICYDKTLRKLSK